MTEGRESPFFVQGAQRGQRIGVFVDVYNLFYSARDLHQAKINYESLLSCVSSGRKIVRSVAYLVTKPEVDQQKFVNALTLMGYETRIKYLKVRPDGSAKGSWNMEMSLEVMAIAPRLDTVVLVTGAGVYVPLVERLRVLGVRTEVVGFQQNTAAELKSAAHAFVPIVGEELLIPDKRFEQRGTERSGQEGDFEPDSIAGRFAAERM